MADEKKNFITVTDSTGAEAYISVDKTNGATILIPDKAAVSLSATVLQQITDTRKGFDYAKLRKDIRLNKKSSGKVTILNDDEVALQAIDLILSMPTDHPVLKIREIDMETAETKTTGLGTLLSDVLLQKVASAGFASLQPDITDIQYVDELPNETAADNDTVYAKGGKLYKLNAAEDAYTEITGTVVKVNKLYPFTTTAKANTLYSLTNKYTNEFNETFERGVYTYDATTNKATLTDLVIKGVKALPEAGEANVVYRLTKADGDKAKDTRWTYANETWTEDTREIVTGSTVPFTPIAVNGTYYNVADGVLKLAKTTNYETVGTIVAIPLDADLPNVEKVTLPKGVVYVLNKAEGDKAKGSKWMFDFTDKEFKAYPPIVASGASIEESGDEF